MSVFFILMTLACGARDEMLVSKGLEDTAFWQTAKTEDMQTVMDEWLVGGEGGVAPLHYSILLGATPELVEGLLYAGADVNDAVNNPELPLVAGGPLLEGYSEDSLVRHLSETSGTLDGWSPLHIAAFRGDELLVSLLLDAGARIKEKDKEGATPLHIAAIYGNTAVAEVLLKHDPNLHAERDFQGRTPLHMAVDQYHFNVLGEFPVSYPFLSITSLEHGDAIIARKPSVVKVLLEHGADVEVGDNTDNTPLMKAVRVLGKSEIQRRAAYDNANLLLQYGADVNVVVGVERYGGLFAATPLIEAVTSSLGVETVALLLDYGANVNFGWQTGRTAIRYAAGQADHDTLKLLLESGADTHINTCDDFAMTPFSEVVWRGTLEAVKLFVQHGADVDHYCDTEVTGGRIGGPNLPARSFPISTATYNPDPEVSRLLLELGADPNAKGIIDFQTPLFRPANPDVAEVFLKYGADIKARDSYGRTPLLFHAYADVFDDEGDRVKVVNLLLAHGANVTARANGGYNALHHLAVKLGAHGPEDIHLAKLFLERGVNPDERSNNGQTPCLLLEEGGWPGDYKEEVQDLLCQ
ncbi:MAG: ankyrin repeat domain-containing protein [Chloroflexi bacterium]|nr:ankyrin repeat domain-containing protein [Chloroflexota bacterium]